MRPPKTKRTILYPEANPISDLRVSEVNPTFVVHRTPKRTLSIRKARNLEGQFDLTARDFAEVLEVTPKTLTRWSKKGETLSSQQADRIAILESIFALGKRVLGSSENVGKWIHSPVLYLNGQKPLDLLKNESGRRSVENALRQIEFGMF